MLQIQRMPGYPQHSPQFSHIRRRISAHLLRTSSDLFELARVEFGRSSWVRRSCKSHKEGSQAQATWRELNVAIILLGECIGLLSTTENA
jgi:hypothetical protein